MPCALVILRVLGTPASNYTSLGGDGCHTRVCATSGRVGWDRAEAIANAATPTYEDTRDEITTGEMPRRSSTADKKPRCLVGGWEDAVCVCFCRVR